MGDHFFVCYASEDRDFVLPLAESLKSREVPVWVDQWNIPKAADWDRAIDDALYGCAGVLIVLSPASTASDEVRGELRVALDEGKRVVPVLIAACQVPRQLRLIQYVDFTSRKPDDSHAVHEVLEAIGRGAPPAPDTQPDHTGRSLRSILIWGSVGAFAGLALGLFIYLLSPPESTHIAILLITVLAGAATGALCGQCPSRLRGAIYGFVIVFPPTFVVMSLDDPPIRQMRGMGVFALALACSLVNGSLFGAAISAWRGRRRKRRRGSPGRHSVP